MLLVFSLVILISQSSNLKISNKKPSKASISKQSMKGPGGMASENQSTPINNNQEEEEDDDEFKLELVLHRINQQEFFVIEHYLIQCGQLRDPHQNIFSPPPQG